MFDLCQGTNIWLAFDVHLMFWFDYILLNFGFYFSETRIRIFPAAPHFSKPYTHILILKFSFFKKAQKVLTKFSSWFDVYLLHIKAMRRFCQFLWSSQKTWTVCPSTLILHQKLGIQIFFIYINISYLLLNPLVFLILPIPYYSSATQTLRH